eukprot:m.263454 g.263454  ORF g.263454 m.263454 type:complete len:362 (+) comp50535_c0_seq1:310-1395(+)
MESETLRAVSPTELKEMMKEKDKILLIDARPYSEYLLSHIIESLSVRLSSLMTRRLAKGTNSLYDLVIQEQKEKYLKIYESEGSIVVVYDKDSAASKITDIEGKTPLQLILRALRKTGKSSCYVDGGFEAVERAFPEMINVPEFEGTVPFPSLQIFDRSLIDPNGHLPPMTPFECQDSPSYKVQSLVASQVTDHVFIGSRKDACNKELLNRLGINAIVNATKDCPHHFEDDNSFNYFRVPVKDTWNQDLPSHFPDCFKFIDRMRSSGNKILIHCTAGISRSATLTIAYIMFSERQALSSAYTFVKSKRPAISPNLDFMGELQQYEKTLGLSGKTQSCDMGIEKPSQDTMPPSLAQPMTEAT